MHCVLNNNFNVYFVFITKRIKVMQCYPHRVLRPLLSNLQWGSSIVTKEYEKSVDTDNFWVPKQSWTTRNLMVFIKHENHASFSLFKNYSPWYLRSDLCPQWGNKSVCVCVKLRIFFLKDERCSVDYFPVADCTTTLVLKENIEEKEREDNLSSTVLISVAASYTRQYDLW